MGYIQWAIALSSLRLPLYVVKTLIRPKFPSRICTQLHLSPLHQFISVLFQNVRMALAGEFLAELVTTIYI